MKLQIFLCGDRISPASSPLIRSQAFEVPDYLISPLQMYVTPLSRQTGRKQLKCCYPARSLVNATTSSLAHK